MGKKWNIYKKLKKVLEDAGFKKHAYIRITRQFTSVAQIVAMTTKDKVFYLQLNTDDVLVDPAGVKMTVGEWQDLYDKGKVDNNTIFLYTFKKDLKVEDK